MAVQKIPMYKVEYIGLSGDSKPTTDVPVGATFYETNTSATYIYNGSAWSIM